MKTRTNTKNLAMAGAALAAFLGAAQVKAEPLITLGANGFGGYDEKQHGSLLGGGVSLTAKDNASFRVKLDLASIALEKPTLYSYGAFFTYPLPRNFSLGAYCRKDGFFGVLGCGADAAMSRGAFDVGSGAEFRPNGTVSVKSSLTTRIRLSFMKMRAKLLGFLNTNKDSRSGGADVELEIAPSERISLFARYGYLTKGDPRGQHAVIGGLEGRFGF